MVGNVGNVGKVGNVGNVCMCFFLANTVQHAQLIKNRNAMHTTKPTTNTTAWPELKSFGLIMTVFITTTNIAYTKLGLLILFILVILVILVIRL
jgi:hypothetical protein